MEDIKEKTVLQEAYQLVDPKAGTPFEKSRTAFISISVVNGSMVISSFFARAMGLVSGDRIALVQSKENNLKWLICKTKQRQGTQQIRIARGVYRVNSLEWARKIGESFRFNTEYKSLIRLYVNMQDTVVLTNFDNAVAFQLFDIPECRLDFNTEEEKQEYIDYLKSNPYIIKASSSTANESE